MKKFALVTTEGNWGDETGTRLITYGSAWDNMGWTALKGLTPENASQIAEVLALGEGYTVVYGQAELKAAMEASKEAEYRTMRQLAAEAIDDQEAGR